MTRATIITRYDAPSYYEHAARLTPDRAVILGPHFDTDPADPDTLRDPFRVARPFAHAMALEMGEPFAWGWYDTPGGLRPAVCAAELLPRGFQVNGRTDKVDVPPRHMPNWPTQTEDHEP